MTIGVHGGRGGRELSIATYTRARVNVDIRNGVRLVRLPELALRLWELGYSPIPLGGDKRPLVRWSAYRLQRPERLEVEAMFGTCRGAQGIALLTGKPHRLAVLDADDEAAAAWCREHLPATRWTRTRRGLHAHFRHPAAGLVATRCASGGGVELSPAVRVDVKGFLGYVVAPGSRHPSGFVYQAEGDWISPVSDLPELPAWIAALAQWRPAPVVHRPIPSRRRGDSPENHFANYLRKAGGIPPEGSGSDVATFRAAVYARERIPELTEGAFVAAVLRERPEFHEAWISSKWRAARSRPT